MIKDLMNLKKHSALIQVNAPRLTAIQRKIVNLFIFIIQSKELYNLRHNVPETRTYELPLHIVKKLSGCNATNNKNIKELLKKLRKIEMEFNCFGKDDEPWGIGSLFSWIDITKGIVSFEMPLAIKSRIIYPKMYTPININLLTNIKYDMTIPLYELLKDHLGAKRTSTTLVIALGSLKRVLGLEDAYKDYRIFRRRILEPSVIEINDKLDLDVVFEPEKNNTSKITGIKFQIQQKTKTLNLDKQLNLFEKDELEIITEYVNLMNDQEQITTNISGYENTLKQRALKDKSILTGMDMTVKKHKAKLKLIEEKQNKTKQIEQDLKIDKPTGEVMSKDKLGELIKIMREK